MKKTAAAVAVTVALMLSGCGAASGTDHATAERCAEIRASYMDGDSATASAVNDSLDRAYERICD